MKHTMISRVLAALLALIALATHARADAIGPPSMTPTATNAVLPDARTNLGASVAGGIWPGSLGGTGVANTGKTITLGGNLVTGGALTQAGAFATTLTSTATTNSTLPAGTHSLAPLDSPSFTTPNLGVATGTSLGLNGSTTLLTGGVHAVRVVDATANPTSSIENTMATNIANTVSLDFDLVSTTQERATFRVLNRWVDNTDATRSTSTLFQNPTGDGGGLTDALGIIGNIVRFGTTSPRHLSSGQTTPPALTSCGGGSPSIDGTDLVGTVTLGTTATGCVITFNAAYVAAPHCVVTWRATPLLSQSYTVSNTAITLTQTSTSSDLVDYICIAPGGG